MNKKAFSVIEVIVSSLILTIAVFGVYKLISENSKIIGNSNNFTQAYFLVNDVIACIENIGFSSFSFSPETQYNFHFGANGHECHTGTDQSVIIDNIEYSLQGTITQSGSNFIDWEIKVSGDGIPSQIQEYTQIPK